MIIKNVKINPYIKYTKNVSSTATTMTNASLNNINIPVNNKVINPTGLELVTNHSAHKTVSFQS